MSSHTNKTVLQITAAVLSAAALMSVPDARENTLVIVAILQFLELAAEGRQHLCWIGRRDSGDSFHDAFGEQDKRFLRRCRLFRPELSDEQPGQGSRLGNLSQPKTS